MIMLNSKLNGKDKDTKLEDVPKLSEVRQDIEEGYIADIHQAISKQESVPEGDEKPRLSCILPRTTNEFERSKSISKIKAIRGISPRKDISVKLPEGSEVLLVSKVYCDSRFKSIAQAVITIQRVEFNFMRIKSQNIATGTAQGFRSVHIIPSHEGELNLCIMVPIKAGETSLENMHDMVKKGLNTFAQEENSNVKSIWLPQFKLGTLRRDEMKPNDCIKRYKVTSEE